MDKVKNGIGDRPSSTSKTFTDRTAESSHSFTIVQILHDSAVHSTGCRELKSAGKFCAPGICCIVTLYLLTVDKNDEIRALAENWPFCSLPYAWTQGRESVSTWVCFLELSIYEDQCDIAAAITKASTSHGSHFF